MDILLIGVSNAGKANAFFHPDEVIKSQLHTGMEQFQSIYWPDDSRDRKKPLTASLPHLQRSGEVYGLRRI